MVIFPIFFLWMVTKRARVEEVQMVLHHREEHELDHPEDKPVGLSQALDQLRLTKSVHLTVNNDFKQFAQAQRNAQRNSLFAERLAISQQVYYNHISGAPDRGGNRSANLPNDVPSFGRSNSASGISNQMI
jgi:hypothetical protein